MKRKINNDDLIGSGNRIYGELLLNLIKLSINDIVTFTRNATAENISSITHNSKKLSTSSVNLIKYWHPSEYMNAYNFLFVDDPIIRLTKENEEIDCSLLGMMNHLSHDFDIKGVRKIISDRIVSCLGFMPVESLGLQVYVKDKNAEINMKKLENDVFDKLVRLTREGRLEWNLSKDPQDKGAAPDLITDRKMEVEGTYYASSSSQKGDLTCVISKYVKSTERKKNYSEYVINVQLIQDDNDGYNSHLLSKGMGKLWNLINKKTPMASGNLSIKDLSDFLTELCD